MFKKTKKFLWTSFVSLIILCIIIFVWLGIFMSRKSEEAISEIGKIYMSEMNKQLEEKFKAVTELRIEQIEGIVRRTPPAESDYGKKLLEELSLSASVRDFSFLGLYSEDGECETIYGEDVEYLSQEEFKTVLKDDSQKITSGMSSSGEKLLLLEKREEECRADCRHSHEISGRGACSGGRREYGLFAYCQGGRRICGKKRRKLSG